MKAETSPNPKTKPTNKYTLPISSPLKPSPLRKPSTTPSSYSSPSINIPPPIPPPSNSPSNSSFVTPQSSFTAASSIGLKFPSPAAGSLGQSNLTALFQNRNGSSQVHNTAAASDFSKVEPTDDHVNKILQDHLVEDVIDRVDSPVLNVGSVSHSLQGGATTRDIYKWSESRKKPQIKRRNSEPDLPTNSSSSPNPDIMNASISDLHASDLRHPGVFRRHFLKVKAKKNGTGKIGFITGNFIDFLVLYGYYGGDVIPEDDGSSSDEEIDEEAPLIQPQQSQPNGTSAKKAFFMVLKAFVGTGVLFLPSAFSNGGFAFSVVVMLILGVLTLHCMALLVETSRKMDGMSFGELAGTFYGSEIRGVVLGSIALSQMGFSCAYYIFIGKNLKDLVMAVTDCRVILPDWVFILFQLLLYVPLSWVRKIKHFSLPSLIADVFILTGLGYIMYYCVVVLIDKGPATDIVWFNAKKFPLFIGTSMFAFEGICLILPIGQSMKQPEKFHSTLVWSIFAIGSIFISVGAIGYLTFGSKVEPMIFLNIQSSPLLTTLQFFYAIAIMLSFPLCVYPAIRITESGLFGDGGVRGSHKWAKNFYRAGLVTFLGAVAWLESDKLEMFVSLVGCLACIPLSFIYPSIFHLKIAEGRLVKLKDWMLIIFGFLALFYTTGITIQQWGVGGDNNGAGRCETNTYL